MATRSETDDAMMLAALVAARRGLGHTAPNPAVGCVIVHRGKIVAVGHHARAGRAHAEAVALEKAGRRARGSTVYVTLEPCCYHGRTPPCTDALLMTEPARVVIGCKDPNPRVAGRGIRALRAAGIRVDVGVLENQCADIIRGFGQWVRHGRPWVELKLAATMDGRIAARGGASKWISSTPSRRLVQTLRARVDAVLVGIGTVLADDPRLTCRARGARQPLRVVLDGELRTPPSARVLRGGASTLLVCAPGARTARRRALEAVGAEILEVGRSDRGAWNTLLSELGRRGVHELMIEGGALVAASALRARVVNGLTFFYNPRVLGGDAVPMIGPLGIDQPRNALRFETRSWSLVGEDLVWHGEIV